MAGLSQGGAIGGAARPAAGMPGAQRQREEQRRHVTYLPLTGDEGGAKATGDSVSGSDVAVHLRALLRAWQGHLFGRVLFHKCSLHKQTKTRPEALPGARHTGVPATSAVCSRSRTLQWTPAGHSHAERPGAGAVRRLSLSLHIACTRASAGGLPWLPQSAQAYHACCVLCQTRRCTASCLSCTTSHLGGSHTV